MKTHQKHSPGNAAVALLCAVCVCVFAARFCRGIFRLSMRNLLTAAFALLLCALPWIARRCRVRLPVGAGMAYYLFLFGAMYLGEEKDFYTKIPWWDLWLHLLSGFCLAAVGLGIWLAAQKSAPPLALTLAWMMCFSLALSCIWEFYEFSCDKLFGTDMQRDTLLQTISSRLIADGKRTRVDSFLLNGTSQSGYLDIGLQDTMTDLMVSAAGAVLFCVLYPISRAGKDSVRQLFVPTVAAPQKKRKKKKNELF